MNNTIKWIIALALIVFGFLFIPLLVTIGLTVGGSFLYVRFMVKKPKTKPKRKTQTPEPIKQEQTKLKMEDFPIA